jgi:hypothetical protein
MDVRQAPDDLARLMGSSAEAWDIADLDPRPLGRDAAMITVRWVCQRPVGFSIWEFLHSYVLGDVVHA